MKADKKPQWLMKAERDLKELEDLELNLIDVIWDESKPAAKAYEHTLYAKYQQVTRDIEKAQATYEKLYRAWDSYYGKCIHNNTISEFYTSIKTSTERVPEWAA